MQRPYRFPEWFLHNWSRTALPAGIVLICLAPVVYKTGGLALMLVYLLLACYMIHQYEEHAEGKFKVFANRLLAGGKEKITDVPIFFVNIVGVWGLYLIIINMAAFGTIAFGLMAAYTTLVNGISHILGGVVERAYNPGLFTSIFLFLPISIFAIYAISQSAETTIAYHLFGIGTAIVVHAVTLVYLVASARR
jgi:hypothetical protein